MAQSPLSFGLNVIITFKFTQRNTIEYNDYNIQYDHIHMFMNAVRECYIRRLERFVSLRTPGRYKLYRVKHVKLDT